jgi:hypothetical protein
MEKDDHLFFYFPPFQFIIRVPSSASICFRLTLFGQQLLLSRDFLFLLFCLNLRYKPNGHVPTRQLPTHPITFPFYLTKSNYHFGSLQFDFYDWTHTISFFSFLFFFFFFF